MEPVRAKNGSRTQVIGQQMSTSEINRALREFSLRLNEDRANPALLRPWGVKLGYDGIISMMQAKGHLPLLSEIIDGRRYVRTCDWGNPASEALVRTNYGRFVGEVRRVVKESIVSGELGLVLDLCRDYQDGIRMADFFTKAGTPLGKDRAFGEAIKQFFKDYELVLKIAVVALDERKKELKKLSPHSPADIPFAGTVDST